MDGSEWAMELREAQVRPSGGIFIFGVRLTLSGCVARGHQDGMFWRAPCSAIVGVWGADLDWHLAAVVIPSSPGNV